MGTLLRRRGYPLRIVALLACLLGWPSGALPEMASNKADRHALVIGNSRYLQSPLPNPVNDASAIAEQLRRSGFDVVLKLDSTQKELNQAIDDLGRVLGERKGIGVFYFAGHGVQLEWRNFLIPVDAKIETPADLQSQAVDVATLVERLRQAKNAANVVILDACRDNPFPTHLEQKGLSQMDAPIGTLIAYATAPGNVASDGGGKYGLYTANLLREMQAPGAKIEDVFKRVRHAVRRTSGGRQVPWESTSLEEDFYLLPPPDGRQPTLDDLDKQYEQELALWETVKGVKETAPLEEYLTKYPAGRFSELAMFRLQRILLGQGRPVVQVATSAPTPSSAGVARIAPYRVGDKYVYRHMNPLTMQEDRRFTIKVTSITDDEVHFNNGRLITDLLGNGLVTPDGRRRTPYQLMVPEFYVGKTWTTRFDLTREDGRQASVYYDVRITGKEVVTVPAGSFDTFRVEANGTSNLGEKLSIKLWVAPDKLNRFVIFERMHRNRRGRYTDLDRQELVSFTPAPR